MRLFPIGVAGALVALLLAVSPSHAQTVKAKVVAVCGAGTRPLVPGVSFLEVDQTGVLCTSAGGGGGGGAVTIVNGGDAAQGSTTDAPCVSGSTTPCTVEQRLAHMENLIAGAIPPGANVIGFTSNDPCSQGVKTNVPIGTSSGNLQLVAGVSAKKVYLCSLSLIGAATAVVNVIEGTGSACTTANEAAVIGSTTAASGMSFAANGGLTLGNGGGTVGVTATAANGLCLLQSGTAALAGNATYVQQ